MKFVLTQEHRDQAEMLLDIISTLTNNTPVENIVSPSQKDELVKYRSIFVVCFKEIVPEVTLKAIASLLGGRHHATIIHARQIHNDLLDPINVYADESIAYKALLSEVRKIWLYKTLGEKLGNEDKV